MTWAALQENSNVQVYVGWEFNAHSTLDGQPFYYAPEFREAIQDINRRYTPDHRAGR